MKLRGGTTESIFVKRCFRGHQLNNEDEEGNIGMVIRVCYNRSGRVAGCVQRMMVNEESSCSRQRAAPNPNEDLERTAQTHTHNYAQPQE